MFCHSFELFYDFLLLKFMFYKPVSLCGRPRKNLRAIGISSQWQAVRLLWCANRGQKNVQQRYRNH